MRKIIAVLFFVTTLNSYAQVVPDQKPDDSVITESDKLADNENDGELIYTVVEEDAEFPGGKDAMMKFVSANLIFPDATFKAKKEGSVIVYFEISKEGKVENAKVIKGFDPVPDAEALRVVKAFPVWKPAKMNGRTVRVRKSIPFKFTLPDEGLEVSYAEAETPAEYEGGEEALEKYIKTNLVYPKSAIDAKKEGTVRISFTLGKNKKVTNVIVEKSLDPFLTTEALRLIKAMPPWKEPAKLDGKPIAKKMVYLVKFTLPK